MSNISLVWAKDNKIQHVADSHIDDSKVQLSEGSAFIKQRHIPETSETARISSMDEIINPHHDSPNDSVELQPAQGFVAYIAACSLECHSLPAVPTPIPYPTL